MHTGFFDVFFTDVSGTDGLYSGNGACYQRHDYSDEWIGDSKSRQSIASKVLRDKVIQHHFLQRLDDISHQHKSYGLVESFFDGLFLIS